MVTIPCAHRDCSETLAFSHLRTLRLALIHPDRIDYAASVPKIGILLAYFEGMTVEEVAERMAAPLGTVKSWVRRSLQRLRSCLER